jgi:uncharacterized protein (TIGR03435 family)
MLRVTFSVALSTVSLNLVHAAQVGDRFDVASIKRSLQSVEGLTVLNSPSPDRWSVRNAPLIVLIGVLYNVPRERILGGPSWIGEIPFDIEAKATDRFSSDQGVTMAKQLLADRFGLRMHTERRAGEVTAVVLAKPDGQLGPRLRPSQVDCEVRDATGRPTCGMTRNVVDGVTQLRLTGQFISNLLVLSGIRREVTGPVVDRTGLSGRFDVQLDYVPQSVSPTTGPLVVGSSLVDAFEDQLGLKIERRQEQVDVLVIDHVDLPSPD